MAGGRFAGTRIIRNGIRDSGALAILPGDVQTRVWILCASDIDIDI